MQLSLSRWRHRAPGLSCRELVALITDYLEGALDARAVRRFEAHIALCEHCAAYLADLRITLAQLGSIDESALSADARAELIAVFRDWRAV